MNIKTNNNKGFTLLEILIAVAIIALLATFVGVSISNAQEQSRNTKRLADMQQVEKALLTYKENVGSFPKPVTDYGDGGVAEGCVGWDTTSFDHNGDGRYWLDILFDQNLLNTVPIDPLNSFTDCAGPNYKYYLFNAGAFGCDVSLGEFYVLGITDMEGNTGTHPASPGFSCTGHDFQTDFEWVTGTYTN